MVEKATLALLSFISLLDNFMFSYVFIDWFSSRIFSSAIHFLMRYLLIASHSDKLSSLPFHQEGTKTKSFPVDVNWSFLKSIALSTLHFKRGVRLQSSLILHHRFLLLWCYQFLQLFLLFLEQLIYLLNLV